MKTLSNTYFFPINSENLGHYFFNAIIAPAIIFQDRAEDIQNIFKEFLLLSTKHADENANCTLELIITEEEVKELNSITDDLKLFFKPLPITRVKQIIFDSEEQMQQTITAIGINTAFIPQHIVSHQKLERIDIQKSIATPKNELTENNIKNVKKFDRLIGAFALMKIATRNAKYNFSINYFTELSKYNSVIKKQITEKKIPIVPIQHNKLIKDNIELKFDDKLFKEITNKENQKIIKDEAGIILFDKFDGATYIASILRYYKAKEGELGTQNIDTLILNNFAGIKEEYTEEVAFFYGYNRGYSSFTKEYTYSEKKVAYKYKLDSLLDYYTIESIYQKTINNIETSADFAYLDNLFPKLSDVVFETKNTENLIEFKILDTIATIPKKKAKPQHPKADFWGLFSHFLEKTDLSKVFDKNSTLALKQSFELYLKNFVEKIPLIETLLNENKELSTKIATIEKENNNLKIKMESFLNSPTIPKKEKQNDKQKEMYPKQTTIEDSLVQEPKTNLESDNKNP